MADMTGIDSTPSTQLGFKISELVKDRPRIQARPEDFKGEAPRNWDDWHKFNPCKPGGFGGRSAIFETPEQTVASELKALHKLDEDTYFGKQRQYDELKAFSHRLNERTDMNATHPELTVMTTPTFAYSDKHLKGMLEDIAGRLKMAKSPEARALLQGMQRAINQAQDERDNTRTHNKFQKIFEQPIRWAE